MSDSWMRMMEQFGQALVRRPPEQDETPAAPVSGPVDVPTDSSNLMGWMAGFGGALTSRGRQDPNVPHEGASYRPGMEQYATGEMFPGSGTGRDFRTDPVTPEEQARNREMARQIFFGPERRSAIPLVDEASEVERFIRDWGLSEQEFRAATEAFQEGRVGAGFGWGALGLAAAIPFVGQTGRGIAKGVRGAARAGKTADQIADANRARLASARRFDVEDAMYSDWADWDFIRVPSDEIPDTLYHVAPRSAREDIARRGLDPDSSTWNTGAAQNQEWWGDAIWERLGDAGEMIPVEYRPEGIYLFDNLDAAREYARNGGDIYAVRSRRIVDDGGELIRDPSVAANWDDLMPNERSYVTRIVPDGYLERVESIAGEGLEGMIAAERLRVKNVLAPEQKLSSGVLVPSYDDSLGILQAYDEFTSLPTVIPEMGRLNRQWMNVQDDALGLYQYELLNPSMQIVDELAALAHWQYVGNNNIQALLRTGRMPVHDSYEQAVLNLMGMHQVPRSQVDAVFTRKAQDSIPLLDNLIASSRTHGGFVAYRGVDRPSLNAAFGDDFYVALAENPKSLIGLTWTDEAYSATSLSPVRAREFAIREAQDPRSTGLLFRITVPNGTGAAPVNGYLNPYSPRFTNEYEMLIGRGSTFRITEVVTPLDQAELLNPKWTHTAWNPEDRVWEHLRRDNLPIIYIEVVP